jgi:hypothetical protein
MTDQTQKIIDQMLKSMEKPTPEALYHQLGRLRNEMPPWNMLGQASSNNWVGRVIAVANACEGGMSELVTLKTMFDHILRVGASQHAGLAIARALDTLAAKLELRMPAEVQGTFIPAGGVFDGFQAVSKVMSAAKSRVFLVDPYADDKLISDFAPLAPEGVEVHVLSDAEFSKPSLRPAVERWRIQWGSRRPLEVRLAPPRSLHDRLIVADGVEAWVLGQSFKDLAKRAHSSLVRMDRDSAVLKIDAHLRIWEQNPVGL